MPDPISIPTNTPSVIPSAPAPAPGAAPDVAADPRAGLSGASPDMSSLSGLAKPANGAPQEAPQHRTLNTVLKAVAVSLAGAASGMGEKRAGEAAAAGVRTGVGLAQQGKENARADQAQQNQTAETQSRIKFQNVQAAEATARAAMYDQQLHNMPQQFQDEHNAKTAAFMKEMQDMGISPTIIADNHGTGANAALEQLTDSHGGVPHMQIVNLGDKVVGYDLGQMVDNNAVRGQVNKIAEIQGLGGNAYTPSRWGMIGKEGREQITSRALSFFMPMPSKDNADTLLQQYKNYQQTYAQNPNADPALKAKLDDTVKMLENSRQNFVKQKGTEAAQVAAAELPIKAATAGAEAKARNDAQVNSEDMETNARMLVEGDKDPSQMSKRSALYDKEIAAANRYSLAKYGKPFDLQKAQSDYKFSTNVGTQNTLKYLNSLTGNPATGTGGILDKLVAASDKVGRTEFPPLNDAAAWARLKTGDPNIVAFHDLATDAADQFAKIMSGSGSGSATSDAKIKQGLEMFDKGFTKGQVKTSAATVRDMLSTRKTELIGDNRYLLRQYNASGATASGATASGSGTQTPQTHAFSVKAWKAANPSGDENAARDAATKAGYTVTD